MQLVEHNAQNIKNPVKAFLLKLCYFLFLPGDDESKKYRNEINFLNVFVSGRKKDFGMCFNIQHYNSSIVMIKLIYIINNELN